MINKFSVKNFKSLKNETTIEIKPITILCGVNSCGKSSILKSLLLLKQTLMSKDAINALTLEGPYQFAQKLDNLLFLFGAKKNKILEYSFELSEKKKILGNITFKIQQCNNNRKKYDNILTNFEVRDVQGNYFKISRNANEHYVPDTNLDIRAGLPCEMVEKIEEIVVTCQNFIPYRLFFRSEKNKICFNAPLFILDMPSEKKSKLHDILENFKRSILNISYLGPLRASPRLAYLQFSESDVALDDSGENSAQVLWRHAEDEIQFNNKKISLRGAIDDAFQMLGINHCVQVSRKEMVYSLEMNINRNSKKTVPITDIGFGVSQLLPVLLKGLLADRESLIMLEQPEIHLHPSCKANLADIFIAWAKDGQRMIIETHSTELIDRLRLRIIEDSSLNDMVNIIFVSPCDLPTDGTKTTAIQIDEMGFPLEWPAGFCDESTKLAEQIVFARVKKRKGAQK